MSIKFNSLGRKSGLLMLMASMGCSSSQPVNHSGSAAVSNEQPQTTQQDHNILLTEWTGPYGGVPAFDKMKLADLKPAVEKGMAAHLAEIRTIANNPSAPTFENTIEAMEKAGQSFGRVMVYYGLWNSNLSTPEFRKVQAELVPQLAEYRSKISQNPKLFQR
ncbi:MAG: peptidase M3, partial [Cytophagales bacterium CG18_big_fil_WC_8_21_14_2_50_42_9]